MMSSVLFALALLLAAAVAGKVYAACEVPFTLTSWNYDAIGNQTQLCYQIGRFDGSITCNLKSFLVTLPPCYSNALTVDFDSCVATPTSTPNQFNITCDPTLYPGNNPNGQNCLTLVPNGPVNIAPFHFVEQVVSNDGSDTLTIVPTSTLFVTCPAPGDSHGTCSTV